LLAFQQYNQVKKSASLSHKLKPWNLHNHCMKTAEIKLTVELDEANNPDNILWESTDSGNADKVPAKAMFLSVWDHNYKNTLKIDLWTKDMPVDEMKRFFYETLQTMGDSFLKATNETLIVEDLRDYCAHFAEKMGIVEGQ